MTPETSAAEILSVIRRITAAWLDGPPGEIVARVTPCFDENVVFRAWRVMWRAMLPAPS